MKWLVTLKWSREAAHFPATGPKLLTAVLVITIGLLLNACGTPGGAPVINRDSRPSAPPPVYSGYYRVQRGDTLYSIAWKMGLDFRDLAAWNRIRLPYTIYPGQRLRLKPQAPRMVRRTTKNTGKSPPSSKKPVVAGKTRKRPSKTSSSKKGAAKNNAAHVSSRLRWRWPTDGEVVQGFSRRNPAQKGVRISGRLGQPVRAAEAGKIVYSGSGLIGYGRLVIIKHNKYYLTAYGYNRKLLVKEGDKVARGERIAEMGLAGGGKPVLHFEIRRGGKPVNPVALLPRHR